MDVVLGDVTGLRKFEGCLWESLFATKMKVAQMKFCF